MIQKVIKAVVPRFIKSRLSDEFKYAYSRQLEDLKSSYSFRFSRSQQNRLLAEYRLCQGLEDYFSFARRWLGVGAVQLPEEIGPALAYLAEESPQRVCEIGTEHGGTTLLLSQLLPSVTVMVGVDLFIKNRPMLERLRREHQRFHLINGSSCSLKTVARITKLLDGSLLDVAFIDGNHSYEGVLKDFLLYRHLVRENGFILFHDIVQDHRARYQRETMRWSGGVPILWTQLKSLYPFREFVQDYDQDGLGIGVIRYSHGVALPQELLP